MQPANATNLDRKSGVAERRELLFLFRSHPSLWEGTRVTPAYLAAACRTLNRKGGAQNRRLIEVLSQNLRPDGQSL
jgi:hypothetical protein